MPPPERAFGLVGALLASAAGLAVVAGRLGPGGWLGALSGLGLILAAAVGVVGALRTRSTPLVAAAWVTIPLSLPLMASLGWTVALASCLAFTYAARLGDLVPWSTRALHALAMAAGAAGIGTLAWWTWEMLAGRSPQLSWVAAGGAMLAIAAAAGAPAHALEPDL